MIRYGSDTKIEGGKEKGANDVLAPIHVSPSRVSCKYELERFAGLETVQKVSRVKLTVSNNLTFINGLFESFLQSLFRLP